MNIPEDIIQLIEEYEAVETSDSQTDSSQFTDTLGEDSFIYSLDY